MSDDHEIGYRRPPEHSRFKPGQSGNPKGRPKGSKNLKTDLREELAEKITLREGERTVRISKQRAVLKSLLAKTLRGDPRAAAVLFNLMSNLLGFDDGAVETDQPLNSNELELLDGLKQRLLAEAQATEKRTGRRKRGKGS